MARADLDHLLQDRHALDAIARAVVSGERGHGAAEDALADDVASIMINRLAAARVPGHQRVCHLPWDAPDRWQRVVGCYGSDLLALLIRRTEKHLAHAAMLSYTHVDT